MTSILRGITALDACHATLVLTLAGDVIVHIDGGGATGEAVEEEVDVRVVDFEVATSATHPLIATHGAERFETGCVLRLDSHEVHVAVSMEDETDGHFVAIADDLALDGEFA